MELRSWSWSSKFKSTGCALDPSLNISPSPPFVKDVCVFPICWGEGQGWHGEPGRVTDPEVLLQKGRGVMILEWGLAGQVRQGRDFKGSFMVPRFNCRRTYIQISIWQNWFIISFGKDTAPDSFYSLYSRNSCVGQGHREQFLTKKKKKKIPKYWNWMTFKNLVAELGGYLLKSPTLCFSSKGKPGVGRGLRWCWRWTNDTLNYGYGHATEIWLIVSHKALH